MANSATTIITEARKFASDSLTLANTAIGEVTKTVNSYTFAGVTPAPLTLAPPEKTFPFSAIPLFAPGSFTPPQEPHAPGDGEYSQIPQSDVGDIPVDNSILPKFDSPATVAQLRAFTDPPPQIKTEFEFPSAPQLLLPAAPFLPDRLVPSAPNVVLPLFDAKRPDNLPDAPADYAAQFEAAYRGIAPTMRAALESEATAFLTKYNPRYAEQMASIEDRLATYIKGGSALSPSIEDAIYSRATGKLDAEYRRTRDAAYSDAAKRGFTMPNGALQSSLRQTRQDAADNTTRAAVEIAVKQAELEQQNLQFAVTTSTQLRTTMLNASLSYHGNLVQLNGQALSYAQSILSAMIEVYNTLVKAYTVQLDAYRAEAAVYESRVRGALAQVQVYQALIDGFKATVEADLSKVKVYQAQIETLNALASVYRIQVETVVSKASLEKLKLEGFSAKVEAFRSEAAAKTSEYQGFSAAINGQEAKFQAYGEQVRAHSVEISSYEAKIRAKQAEIQAAMGKNEGLVRRYQAEVDGYRAIVAGKAQVATAELENKRVELIAVQAQFSAEQAKAQYGLEYYKAVSLNTSEIAKYQTTTLIESAKIVQAQMQSVANVSISGAQVYQGLGSAALSGINTLVSQSLVE